MSEGIRRSKARAYLSFIEFTRRHPHLCRAALFLLDRLPIPGRCPSTVTRLYLGGRALDNYHVDLGGGL